MKPPDLGNYTQDETVGIAIEALGHLSLEQKVQAVLKAFPDLEEREELASWLSDDNEDPKSA